MPTSISCGKMFQRKLWLGLQIVNMLNFDLVAILLVKIWYAFEISLPRVLFHQDGGMNEKFKKIIIIIRRNEHKPIWGVHWRRPSEWPSACWLRRSSPRNSSPFWISLVSGSFPNDHLFLYLTLSWSCLTSRMCTSASIRAMHTLKPTN